jgi:hypothetical protein
MMRKAMFFVTAGVAVQALFAQTAGPQVMVVSAPEPAMPALLAIDMLCACALILVLRRRWSGINR